MPQVAHPRNAALTLSLLIFLLQYIRNQKEQGAERSEAPR